MLYFIERQSEMDNAIEGTIDVLIYKDRIFDIVKSDKNENLSRIADMIINEDYFCIDFVHPNHKFLIDLYEKKSNKKLNTLLFD